MKIFIVFIFSFISSSVFSQEYYHNILTEENSNIQFTEIKLKNNRIVPIKDVFLIVNAENQKGAIDAVKKLIVKEKLDDAVFYFTKISSEITLTDQQKAFKNIIDNFGDRIKMIESNLFAIVHNSNIVLEYNKVVIRDKKTNQEYGYPRPIRDILLSTNTSELIEYIINKTKLPPYYYDNKH